MVRTWVKVAEAARPKSLGLLALAVGAVGMASPSRAAIIITEVNAAGSSHPLYAADWFELTNTGASAVDISGWKVDDDSASSGSALAFRNGPTSIPAGKSMVFMEGNATGTNDAQKQTDFKTAWFGANVPADFLIGSYGGSGIGLSGTNGDQVNIYDAGNNLMANVSFGAEAFGATFDNAAGLNNAAISTLSVAGVNGAFASPSTSSEIGSPGVVPEPGTLALFSLLTALSARRRRSRPARPS